MVGTAPREGTFTRDLRINSSRVAPSSDEAAVLRSPTNHSANVGGPDSFSDPVSLAKTRQRRDVQLAGPRSPTAPYGNSTASVPPITSPSHAFTHTTSPAYGADRASAKPLLSPTGRRRSRSYFSNSSLRMTLVVITGGFLVFLVILFRSLRAPQPPESQPASACEAPYDTLEPHAHPLHHSIHEGEHGDFPLHSARASIALVTMADTRKVPLPKNLAYLSDIKPGSLVNILEVVWRNRQEYADRHGYTLVNGTDLVGKDRPPSWYKLKVLLFSHRCVVLSAQVLLTEVIRIVTGVIVCTLGQQHHAPSLSSNPYIVRACYRQVCEQDKYRLLPRSGRISSSSAVSLVGDLAFDFCYFYAHLLLLGGLRPRSLICSFVTCSGYVNADCGVCSGSV